MKFETEKGKPGRKSWFFHENDDYILARTHMYEFSKSIVDFFKSSNKTLRILEVGPSSNLYKENQYCCGDISTSIIGSEARRLGHSYKTLDIEGTADFLCSIEEVSSHVGQEKFDVIVLLGIIEHVANIHLLSEEFFKITNKNAKVFINTPYMFKVHGPIPDYWRISQYGYQHLFSKHFDLEFDVYPPGELGKNSFPLSFNVTLTKKMV